MWFSKQILFNVVSKENTISCGLKRKAYLMWYPKKIIFNVVSKENNI